MLTILKEKMHYGEIQVLDIFSSFEGPQRGGPGRLIIKTGKMPHNFVEFHE